MILNQPLLGTTHQGYIAGTGDGIVTVNGNAAQREVYVLDSQTLAVVQRSVSLKNGHYLFTNLDPEKRYLVMCRDLPPNDIDQRFEPATWDYVEPATDLTIAEQQQMWQQWMDEVYQQQLAQG